jgi:MFS transporter, ACS family, allantoate permease
MLICYCICIAIMAGYWFLCVVLNRKVVPAYVPEGNVDVAVDSFQDLTDFKQEGFKYTT